VGWVSSLGERGWVKTSLAMHDVLRHPHMYATPRHVMADSLPQLHQATPQLIELLVGELGQRRLGAAAAAAAAAACKAPAKLCHQLLLHQAIAALLLVQLGHCSGAGGGTAGGAGVDLVWCRSWNVCCRMMVDDPSVGAGRQPHTHLHPAGAPCP